MVSWFIEFNGRIFKKEKVNVAIIGAGIAVEYLLEEQ